MSCAGAGIPALYGATGNLIKRKYYVAETVVEWAIHRPGLFPSVFTLCASAVCAPAIGSVLMISMDATANYWFGKVSYFMLLVPLCLIVCHWFHACAGRPRFYLTCCSTVVPALIVIIVGSVILSRVYLTSSNRTWFDCSTGTSLEVAYREAYRVFDTCANRVANQTGSTLADTVPKIDILDCKEYIADSVAVQYASQWAYLGAVETSQACTGWCTPGSPALWSRHHVYSDICSYAVYEQLWSKVGRLARHMIVCGIVQLVASVLCLHSLSLAMYTMGVAW